MSDTSTIASVEHGGFTVTSNSTSAEAMKAGFEANEKPAEGEAKTPEPAPPKTAAEIGKKGGEATAAIKRAEARKAKEAEQEAAPGAESEGGPRDETKTDGGEPEKAKDAKKGNPRHDPIARMQEATREASEARKEVQREREARQALERRLAELERGREAPPKPPSETVAGEPQESDYADYKDYTKALAKWEVKQELAQERAAAQKQWREQARNQRLDGYVAKFSQAVAKAAGADGLTGEAFKAKIAEWNTQLSPDILALKPTFRLTAEDGPPTGHTWIADEIIDNTAHAPALMLHLSEHPEDYQRIAALETPRAVTREMAILVKSLAAAPTDTDAKPTVSRAAPPVKPVTGSPHFAEEKGFREGMSLDDYARRQMPHLLRR